MKQNTYRTQNKVRPVACVALSGLSGIKYARIVKNEHKAFKLALPEFVYDWLFIFCGIVAVSGLAWLAHSFLVAWCEIVG
jgi:hypothetical protein